MTVLQQHLHASNTCGLGSWQSEASQNPELLRTSLPLSHTRSTMLCSNRIMSAEQCDCLRHRNQAGNACAVRPCIPDMPENKLHPSSSASLVTSAAPDLLPAQHIGVSHQYVSISALQNAALHTTHPQLKRLCTTQDTDPSVADYLVSYHHVNIMQGSHPLACTVNA